MENKEEKRECQNCKVEFEITDEDQNFYTKISVPPPTFCPECRLQRRLGWRNERGLYNRICNLCRKNIVSIYKKELNNLVYCDKCFWSDSLDAIDYGKDYNFSKSFFEQFFELFLKVPVPNLFTFGTTMINSQYCNMANDMKNCYLLHDGTFDENVSYGSGAFFVKDSQDITMCRKCELCYETITCVNCYRTIFSEKCQDCVDVSFSYGLRGCNNCFGCINLDKKNYYIFNEPYSKEEYEQKIKSFKLDSYKNILVFKEKVKKFFMKFPRKYYFGILNNNVSGDYLEHSKNSKFCFGCNALEDSKFCSFVSNGPVKTTYDFTHYGDNIELVYESLQSGDGIYNVKFGWGNWMNTNNTNYCITIPGTSYSFGCISLKKKKYCILNKQYTKEEYEELMPKIIEHMNTMPYIDKKGRVYKYGEFFPLEFSPFGYNDTTAQEYFNLTKEEVEEKGFNWSENKERNYKITKKSLDIPDSINEIDDSILNEVISCEHEGKCNENCQTAFKVLLEDYKFYKRMNLPLPRLCPNCRHYQRLKYRNPLKLWHRKCMKENCTNEFETSYAPDRPEIIYCEECYKREIY